MVTVKLSILGVCMLTTKQFSNVYLQAGNDRECYVVLHICTDKGKYYCDITRFFSQ